MASVFEMPYSKKETRDDYVAGGIDVVTHLGDERCVYATVATAEEAWALKKLLRRRGYSGVTLRDANHAPPCYCRECMPEVS